MNHDVYVLIPGITGSVLQKDGHDVFGLTAGAGLRALFTAGGSIRHLRLAEDPPEADDLGDGIRAGRLAADAHLIPGLWKIDGYGKVGEYLRQRLRLNPGESYFEFPYDWRRDNRVAARQLAARAQDWLGARRAAYPDARLVLVAHSMGYQGKDLGGDGTVPRVSAFPQEADDDSGAMFAATRHASLQNTDAVLTQVRGWMTGVKLGAFRAGAPISLSLDLADVYPADGEVRATVQPSAATGGLLATLEWVAGPEPPAGAVAVPLPAQDGPRAIEIRPPAPGCYRLTVSGTEDVEPVADLLLAAPA